MTGTLKLWNAWRSCWSASAIRTCRRTSFLTSRSAAPAPHVLVRSHERPECIFTLPQLHAATELLCILTL